MKWNSIVRLSYQIHCLEGLRIGGSGGGLEIGEIVDANLSALRDPASGEPYIPGSSLKGKIRSVLERHLGKLTGNDPCGCEECLVCKVFGAHKKANSKCAPTRIVVRDARLSQQSREIFEQRKKAGEPNFEVKTENIVKRKTGAADHPRSGERVLPGTCFDGEIILHVYEGDKDREMVQFVRQGLGIIQEGSSLGASGSRGYGKVRFENVREEVRPLAQMTV